jgi:hypothetical protein
MVDINKNWPNNILNIEKTHSKEYVLEYLNNLYDENDNLNDFIKKLHTSYNKTINDSSENNFFALLFASFVTIPLGMYLDWHHILIGTFTVGSGILLSIILMIKKDIQQTYNFNIFQLIFNKNSSIKKSKIDDLKKLFRQNKKLINTLKFISHKTSISKFLRSLSFSESQHEFYRYSMFKDKILTRFDIAIDREFKIEDKIEILSNFLLNKKENGVTIFFKEILLKIIEKEKKVNEEQLIYAENSTILKENKNNTVHKINTTLKNNSKKLSYIKSL